MCEVDEPGTTGRTFRSKRVIFVWFNDRIPSIFPGLTQRSAVVFKVALERRPVPVQCQNSAHSDVFADRRTPVMLIICSAIAILS